MIPSTHRRIPGLDGLRAIGVGCVLVCHVLLTHTVMPGRIVGDDRYVRLLGDWGVRLFFVLSGFLITTLLVREHDASGTISLRSFFARRVVRIFPAFFVYIGVMCALAAAGIIELPGSEIVGAAGYVMNFMQPDTWWLSHTWSLADEEQFYLLWPAVLSLGGMVTKPIVVCVVAIIVAPLLRVATVGMTSLDEVGRHGFPFVVDSLAIGCLLALLRPRLEANARYVALLASRWFWFVPMALVGAMVLTEPHAGLLPYPRLAALAMSAANVGIALAIHRVIAHPDRLATRVLETRGFVWIGTISYSLYLWQQPFVDRYYDAPISQFPISFVCAVAAAAASYYLVERPILQWAKRAKVGVSAPRGLPTST